MLLCAGSRTNRQTEFRDKENVFFYVTKPREWYTIQCRELANENVQDNPNSGQDRRGSNPGVTGLKYQGVRLES